MHHARETLVAIETRYGRFRGRPIPGPAQLQDAPMRQRCVAPGNSPSATSASLRSTSSSSGSAMATPLTRFFESERRGENDQGESLAAGEAIGRYLCSDAPRMARKSRLMRDRIVLAETPLVPESSP